MFGHVPDRVEARVMSVRRVRSIANTRAIIVSASCLTNEPVTFRQVATTVSVTDIQFLGVDSEHADAHGRIRLIGFKNSCPALERVTLRNDIDMRDQALRAARYLNSSLQQNGLRGATCPCQRTTENIWSSFWVELRTSCRFGCQS